MTFPPNDFPNDPYAAVTSQAGHAAIIGMPACMILLALGWPLWAAPIAVAVVYLLAWEGAVQRFDLPADSLMDTASVMAGASVIAGAMDGLLTAAVCLLAWLVVMALEWARRA